MVQTLKPGEYEEDFQSRFLKAKWTNNINKFEGCFLRGLVS